MGGAQHPVIGNYGVMSAKNGAINVMICLTTLSYILYRRANRTMVVPWVRAGGRAAKPALTLTLSVPTFARMMTGEAEPGRAWLEGAVQIEGDLPVAARLATWIVPAHAVLIQSGERPGKGDRIL